MMNKAMIHPTALIDEGAHIGEGTKVWHFTHVMNGAAIGKECILGQNVFVASGVVLGDRCKVQNNVSLYTGVVCDEEVFIGPSVVFTNIKTPRAFIERKDSFLPTTISRGASIGANATIVCGTQIGSYAMVAAGAVVTHDVEPYELVAGVPARVVGYVSKRGCVLCFDQSGKAICPESGALYQLIEGKIIPLHDE